MTQKQKNRLGIMIFLIFVAAAIFAYQPKSLNIPASTNTANTYLPTNNLKTLHDGTYNKMADTSDIYSLQYPRDFELLQLENARGGFIGTSRLSLVFPKGMFTTPKSNFNEAYLTVRIGIDADSIENCYTKPENAKKEFFPGPTINMIPFEMTTTTDIGAGGMYESRVYRTLQNKRCYEITETIHTGNIGNYEPGTVAQFDKQKAYTELDKILNTFTLVTKDGPVE